MLFYYFLCCKKFLVKVMGDFKVEFNVSEWVFSCFNFYFINNLSFFESNGFFS